MSTVPDALTIIGLKKGASSNISKLYKPSKAGATAADEIDLEVGAD
jgi:hypothetical protein